MSTTPAKGRADYLQLGDWNAACAECGRKRKASMLRQLPPGVPGGGMWVCFPEHWNPRQPQDYVRGVPEKMNAPWVQEQTQGYQLDGLDPTEDDPTAVIDVCSYAVGPYIITVNEWANIPVLTIPLGTGPSVSIVINNFGYVGQVVTTTSSDPCLPSGIVSVTGIGVASLLGSVAFTEQPSAATTATVIAPAVEISVYAANGNLISDYTGNVTIELGENPGGATLGGTLTVAAVAGVATFSDLVVNAAGTGYTLIATATGILPNPQVESSVFNISPPAVVSSLLNAPAGGEIYPYIIDGLGRYGGGVGFYNGVFWFNYGSSVGNGPYYNVAVFQFTVQNTPIATASFSPSYRAIRGNIYDQTTPPGYALLASNTSGSIWRIGGDAIIEGPITSGFTTSVSGLNTAVFADTEQAIFSADYQSGLSTPMAKLSSLSWAFGTATLDGNYGSLSPTYRVTAMTMAGAVVDSRAYCVLTEGTTNHLAWIHTGTGALTILASFANPVACSLLAGQFDSGASNVLFNMSGNASEANILQKRDLDGGLLGTVALPNFSTTNFDQLSAMCYDYLNNHVWVQSVNSPFTATCVDVASMTVLAQGAISPTTAALIVPPVGHPSGGAVLAGQTGIYRLYLG